MNPLCEKFFLTAPARAALRLVEQLTRSRLNPAAQGALRPDRLGGATCMPLENSRLWRRRRAPPRNLTKQAADNSTTRPANAPDCYAQHARCARPRKTVARLSAQY